MCPFAQATMNRDGTKDALQSRHWFSSGDVKDRCLSSLLHDRAARTVSGNLTTGMSWPSSPAGGMHKAPDAQLSLKPRLMQIYLSCGPAIQSQQS